MSFASGLGHCCFSPYSYHPMTAAEQQIPLDVDAPASSSRWTIFFFVAAIWYLLLTSVWSLIQNRLEARLARSDRAVVAVSEKTSLGRLTGVVR